jgi:ABC-type polysaccharide/polyol phosphate export permease
MLVAASETWSHRGLIWNLTTREVKVKYKRSALGWLWSLINPAATLAIYTVVFSSFLRIDPPVAGDGETKSFALFLFVALVAWGLFGNIINGAMQQMVASGPLLKKVYFPPACPVIAIVLSSSLQTAMELAILVVVLLATGLLAPVVVLAIPILVLVSVFAFGLGLLLGLGNVYYRDVGYLVGIVLNMLFYATPIVYPFSIVPEHLGALPARTLITLNPLTQFVGALRDVAYLQQMPSAGRMGGIVLATGISAALGWWVFNRKARDISEEL